MFIPVIWWFEVAQDAIAVAMLRKMATSVFHFPRIGTSVRRSAHPLIIKPDSFLNNLWVRYIPP